MKNYIIIGDMFHSIQMLFFREEDVSLHLVAKDFDHKVVTKTETIQDGSKLAMVAGDDRGNLFIYQQNPK